MGKNIIYLAALLFGAPESTKSRLNESMTKFSIDQSLVEDIIQYAIKIALSKSQPTLAFSKVVGAIFDGILKKESSSFYIPVQPLEISLELFPRNTLPENDNSKDQWKEFAHDLQVIKDLSLEQYSETVLHLLHKYASTVPCGYSEEPEVSYYDLAKNVAGIALSLWIWWEDKRQEATSISLRSEDRPLILIGGDLSGIQNYIFDIISKSAAKNLKGRSFYLELLMDSIIQLLLKHCELNYGNIV